MSCHAFLGFLVSLVFLVQEKITAIYQILTIISLFKKEIFAQQEMLGRDETDRIALPVITSIAYSVQSLTVCGNLYLHCLVLNWTQRACRESHIYKFIEKYELIKRRKSKRSLKRGKRRRVVRKVKERPLEQRHGPSNK